MEKYEKILKYATFSIQRSTLYGTHMDVIQTDT